MRADAKKNRDHLLAVAREAVMEAGANVSLRDIARRAGVGLGTLYRHFPRREVLLEALLRASFDDLAARAGDLERTASPEDALVMWLREIVTVTHDYRGAIAPMVAAIEEPDSALHASCVAMKAAGTQLLVRAQTAGSARADIDGTDLFALVSALAWLHDQPSFAARAHRLSKIIADAIFQHSGVVHDRSFMRQET